MPGQFLQGAQVDAGPAAQGEVGVPQCVEVGVQWAVRSLNGVGDARGRQVATEHFGALAIACPRPAPDGLTGRPVAQVGPQQVRQVRRQRLPFCLAVLGVAGGKGDGRLACRQVEVLRGQGCQGGCAEASAAGGGVQVEAIPARQTAEVAVAVLRRVQRAAQLGKLQFSAIMPAVRLDVAALQVRQGGVSHTPIPREPSPDLGSHQWQSLRQFSSQPATSLP
jgi:hypothetical protein